MQNLAPTVITGTRTIVFPAERLPEFNHRTRTLHRHLQGGVFSEPVYSKGSQDRLLCTVIYTGPVSVTVGAHELVGTVDWVVASSPSTTEVHSVINTAPGRYRADVEASLGDSPTCDHCGKARSRKLTLHFLPRPSAPASTRPMQVGGACAKLFVPGGVTFAKALADLELLERDLRPDHDQGEGSCSSRISAYDPRDIVALSLAMLRIMPYSKDGGSRDDLLALLHARRQGLRCPREWGSKQAREFEPATPEEVDAYLADVAAYAPASDFWLTIKELLAAPYVLDKHLGRLVAGVAFRPLAPISPSAAADTFLGAEGQRLEEPVTLRCTGVYENDWGSTKVFEEVATGRRVTLFGKFPGGAEKGETYTVTCFVKKHDTYNGRKSTIINRVKVLDTSANTAR